MNRSDFLLLADVRLGEAKTLLDAGGYPGAYYLAGYAVECALKACICRQTVAESFPPDRKTVDLVYSHNLVRLLQVAGLDGQLSREVARTPGLARSWTVVARWSEAARYRRPTRREAEAIWQAIVDPNEGVLTWLRQHC